jgi:hypothetical protein
VKATKESWRTKPMPEQREQLDVVRHFGADEYERLAQGLVPASQDDRWFVYVDDDHVVHVHRSWSGDCIYEVELVPSAGGYDIARAWANRDPEQTNTDPRHDKVLLSGLLDQLALGARA